MDVGVAAVRRTVPDGRTGAVAVGDVLAIVGVLTVGMLRHEVDPVATPDHAFLVVAPFLLGWVLAAPFAGAYAASTLRSARTTVATALLAWLVAALVGVALRATAALPGNSPPVFVAVVLVFGTLAVGGWRAVVALALR